MSGVRDDQSRLPTVGWAQCLQGLIPLLVLCSGCTELTVEGLDSGLILDGHVRADSSLSGGADDASSPSSDAKVRDASEGDASEGDASEGDAAGPGVIATDANMGDAAIGGAADFDGGVEDAGECLPKPYYLDEDGDGAGVTAQSVKSCARPVGYATAPGDCDDACPTCFPQATDTCDGLDNDCDDAVDEDLPEVTCGSNLGVCQTGTANCVNGQWSCLGAIWGSPVEICDGALDDDCDGSIDEGGCECNNGEPMPCGSAVGLCIQGAQVCADGEWGACSGGTQASPELCDGLDNDCDSAIDELVADQSCQNVQGVCGQGTESCVQGQWSACSTQQSDEICDGALDDDCDGSIDEGVCACTNGEFKPCGSSVGLCVPGAQECVAGEWSECVGGVGPVTETCAAGDNDCDGKTDENCASGCNASGACKCDPTSPYVCSVDDLSTEYCDQNGALTSFLCDFSCSAGCIIVDPCPCCEGGCGPG